VSPFNNHANADVDEIAATSLWKIAGRVTKFKRSRVGRALKIAIAQWQFCIKIKDGKLIIFSINKLILSIQQSCNFYGTVKRNINHADFVVNFKGDKKLTVKGDLVLFIFVATGNVGLPFSIKYSYKLELRKKTP